MVQEFGFPVSGSGFRFSGFGFLDAESVRLFDVVFARHFRVRNI